MLDGDLRDAGVDKVHAGHLGDGIVAILGEPFGVKGAGFRIGENVLDGVLMEKVDELSQLFSVGEGFGVRGRFQKGCDIFLDEYLT